MKSKKIVTSLTLFVFFIFMISFASAIIPSTEPCWVKGTVTAGDGFDSVNGLTVRAYKGSDLLISDTISDNQYSLNSVGANDGNTIALKVYGHTFASFTFQGFCKTGEDPWIVEDFTVSKQANGQACTNGAICNSGYCSPNNVCAIQTSGRTTTTTTSTTTSTTTTTVRDTSHQLIEVVDKIRSYYAGNPDELTLLELLDMIRAYYGG